MTDYGVVTAPGAVKFERVLPGPIERVWAYLTEPEKRAKWLAAGKMELHEGGRVTLEFRHADLSAIADPVPERYKEYEHGSTMEGRVTRCEPPALLSFTWGEKAGESHVTFELTPRGKDVVLTLTHERLPNRTEMVSVSGGWHTHLDILSAVLSGGEPRPFWSTHVVLEDEYERRIGRTRAASGEEASPAP